MKDTTKLLTAGRPHHRPAHPVNMGVERASTYLFPTYDDFIAGGKAITYGRLGGANHRALEEAVNILEGGYETRLASSGLQACVASILAFVKAGDEILMTDSAYDPTRKFCERFLSRFGVATKYYDPCIGADIQDLVTPNTKLIFAESPGSLTFEIQDLPAIAAVAQNNNIKLVVDNTWAAGYYYKPISLGADVSIQAGTKYLVGHGDCLLGTITSRDEDAAHAIYYSLLQLGSNVSADDAWLALRGMRTLSSRLPVHEQNGLQLAKWLAKRPEVTRVLHPALKSSPGHAIWKRDFTGSTGLFSAVLKPVSLPAIKAFFNTLKIFGMGFSWGAYESLCIHVKPEQNRSATEWNEAGPTFRFHAGLEDFDDLVVDLEIAFAAMESAATS